MKEEKEFWSMIQKYQNTVNEFYVTQAQALIDQFHTLVIELVKSTLPIPFLTFLESVFFNVTFPNKKAKTPISTNTCASTLQMHT